MFLSRVPLACLVHLEFLVTLVLLWVYLFIYLLYLFIYLFIIIIIIIIIILWKRFCSNLTLFLKYF